MTKYAAFVMTYRRPAILKETVAALFAQSLAPSKVLIIDNDPEQAAKAVAEQLVHHNVAYHAVGYNSGPAGAAYWGCKLLHEEGWEWMLWVDDDDPPVFSDTIEQIFKIASVYPQPSQIGIIGAVGVNFDPKKAKTLRIPDVESGGLLEVDNIAGNQFPIIHKRVFESGVFPNPDLFFGFEELEFNLRVKRSDFKIVIASQTLQSLRVYWKTYQKKTKIYIPKKEDRMWREYYSTRNLVYILRKISISRTGLIVFFFRSLSKSLFGFRYGLQYGVTNAKAILKGLFDGFSGKLGPL